MAAVRPLASPPYLTVYIVLASTPDLVEAGPVAGRLRVGGLQRVHDRGGHRGPAHPRRAVPVPDVYARLVAWGVQVIAPWAAAYVGLPYRAQGRTRQGCDCFGLARLVLSDIYGVTLPSYAAGYDLDAGRAGWPDITQAIALGLAQWAPVERADVAIGDGVVLSHRRAAVACGRHRGYGAAPRPAYRGASRRRGRAARRHRVGPAGRGVLSLPDAGMSVELWTPPTAVTVARHAFRTETVTLEMPHGATIDEIIVAAGLPTWAPVRVWVGEWEIAPEHWGITRPRPGRRVLIRAVPRGGGGGDSNKTLRMVLMVVVVIAALALTIVIAGSAPGSAAGLLGLTGAAAGWRWPRAISIGGMYAINALLPPPKPKLRDQTLTAATPTYAITGTQNQLAPYQAVPRVYGRHRLYPPLAAFPVTAGQGTTQTLSQLFTLGYGPLQIEDIRIGDTPIGLYEGVTLEVRHGWPPGVQAPLTTFPYDTFEEPLGIDLTPPEGSTSKTASRATAPADVIGIEVLFPRGLFRVEADNVTQGFSGVLTVIGVPASTGGAVRLLEQVIKEQRVESLRFSYAFDVQAYGETPWTLHVTWAIPPGWEGPERPNPVVILIWCWSALRLTNYEDPIPLPGMAKIGLTLLASGQLTGIVNQLNCIATSILPVWDIATTAWVLRETRNPAWIYRDILLGSATARPVALEPD